VSGLGPPDTVTFLVAIGPVTLSAPEALRLRSGDVGVTMGYFTGNRYR
jgi:hypothetical protein